MFNNKIEKDLDVFLKRATELGLPASDVENAKEALDANEWEVCFDTIATQMYEYEKPIDLGFLELGFRIVKQLGIHGRQYIFLEELLNTRRMLDEGDAEIIVTE